MCHDNEINFSPCERSIITDGGLCIPLTSTGVCVHWGTYHTCCQSELVATFSIGDEPVLRRRISPALTNPVSVLIPREVLGGSDGGGRCESNSLGPFIRAQSVIRCVYRPSEGTTVFVSL